MYNVPTPDEYRESFERTQHQMMDKFLTDVGDSLSEGNDRLIFLFPDKLSPEFCEKVKEIFIKKGWNVSYAGINSKYLKLRF